MPIIEIISDVDFNREIEAYTATLELTTSASRKVACVDLAVSLREKILTILRNSGLAESDIREGGGEVNQSYWSSTKTVVHRIEIRNKDMNVLMSAMAATDKHFVTLPSSFFSTTKYNFTFHAPKPIHSTTGSADKALQAAIQNARNIATTIATEAGHTLGSLIAVVEQTLEQRTSPHDEISSITDFDTSDLLLSKASPTYTPLPQNTPHSPRRFRIRFATEDIKH